MEDESTGVRLAEYSSLREEVLQNKKYIFERPLLIITAAGIASVRLSGEPSLAFLPLLLIIVLLSNLWFTVNRLQSNARIVAYLAVALEPASQIEWVGWENALRRYRAWKKGYTREEQDAKIQRYVNRCAIPDAMSFYPALWRLHVATVFVALGSSGVSLANGLTVLSINAFSLTLLTGAVFFWYCLRDNRPEKTRDLLENERATWLAVFCDPFAEKPVPESSVSKPYGKT